MAKALRFLTFGVVAFSILALSVSPALATTATPLAAPFGTDAAGSPQTWLVTGLVGGSFPSDHTAFIDGSGYLNYVFGPSASAAASNAMGNASSLQVTASAGTSNPFGAHTAGTPWIQVSWIDTDLNTVTTKQSRVDFFATDTVGGHFTNRVTSGSVFGNGSYSAERVTPATAIPNYPTGSGGHFTGAPGAGSAASGAVLRGSGVEHTARYGKRADGTLDLIFDGALMSSNAKLADLLGTNHSIWTTIEVRIRAADPGETFKFTSFAMGSDHAYLSGDTDADNDVDNGDLGAAFGNFTGPSSAAAQIAEPSCKLGSEGDTDGDNDVDNGDLGAAFGNFTGPGSAGNLTDTGTNADLIYDPATGNVKLDASEASGGIITNFVLRNAAGGTDFNTGVAVFPTPTTFATDSATEISWTDGSSAGFSGIHNLGNIFPTGLDLTSLAAFLTAANYVGSIGTGTKVLDLVIAAAAEVPEPGTFVLLGLGCLVGGYGIRRKRRNRS